MSGPLGVTAVTNSVGSLNQPSGNQGAPKTSGSATAGRGQKVMVSMPKAYCSYAENTGYMNSDRTNYLK
jgi:hypothetical protein